MLTQIDVENQIREFFAEQLMKEWALSLPLTEKFELDSVDQVDFRIFLEETFSIKMSTRQKPFCTIQSVIEFLKH